MARTQVWKTADLEEQKNGLLPEADLEEQEQEKAPVAPQTKVVHHNRFLVFIYITLTVFNIAIWYSAKGGPKDQSVDYPFPYADINLQHIRKTFDPAGIHGVPGVIRTPYEGRPTTENSQAWANVTEHIGYVGLNDDEYKGSGLLTAEPPMLPGKHVVIVTVFHQLHCLDMLRQYFWNSIENILQGSGNDPSSIANVSVHHTDHCIEYLRQTIMCNADLTPGTFETELTEDGKLYSEFRDERKCRDFDKIQEWAKKKMEELPGLPENRFGDLG